MSRKIWAKGFVAVLAIILIAAIAIGIVKSNKVDDVQGVALSEATASTVDISWRNVKNADGYKVFYNVKDSEDTEQLEVKNNRMKTLTLTVENLEQATEYDFYVIAYKNKSDKTIESKKHIVASTMTAPLKQTVELDSPDEGLLDITVCENSKAKGYEIEYSVGENSDFKDAECTKIEDSTTVKTEIEGLTVNEKYSVRARSFIQYHNDDGEYVYGEWSDAKQIVISEKIAMASNIDPSKPMIALSFDDGPSYNDASGRILDVLEKYGARASFFMLGKNSSNCADDLKRKVALGCEIGNHTYDHEKYGKNVDAGEIKNASEAIYKACGQYPTAFRSPGGMTTDLIRTECESENMPIYYWSLDTEDWKSRNADAVYNAVMNNVKDGDIILMHEIYESTADAVEKMVPELIQKGYQLVTCQELVIAKTGEKPKPGVQYITATETN